MQETITMTSREQQRAQVLTRLMVGDVTAAEAAVLLGLSERQVWRLRAGYGRDGPAALVHGNRGRASARRLDPALAERVLLLARTTYDGANDCHLAELLGEREGIGISRSSLRRLLRAAGRPSPRRRRAPRHRSRRDRMPQEGMLLQVDGSRHDWLEGRGPRLTLVGGIDDATGRLTGATFREQEDTAGYLLVLRDTVRRHGIPLAVYRDRHTLFEAPRGSLMTLEEQLADTRVPTQLGRALGELGITSIAARSPQAKGRIERAWGTLQDRLVTELRLAGAVDRDAAEVVLARFLPRFNRRFAVPAADPAPAWRPLPAGTRIERVCCLKYRRVVANDHTVRAGATILQLPPGPGRRGYAGRRVELQLRLDGRMVVWDGERELLAVPAPADPAQLRALEAARGDVGSAAPSAATASGTIPATDHPWRRMPINGRRPGTRLTESRSR
ncbi:MAG: ISNCY family transposase [Candidatus Limnocylindrales bacterium]